MGVVIFIAEDSLFYTVIGRSRDLCIPALAGKTITGTKKAPTTLYKHAHANI